VRIGSKKVDLVFKKREYGKTLTYLVECKKWTRPLRKLNLERIWASYDALLSYNQGYKLLVVSGHQLNADANSYLNECRDLLHQTYAELEAAVIDFFGLPAWTVR